MISIHALSKSYNGKEVLKDIELNLLKGNVYGIVGENGAGKTTLFRCIAGLESYAGSIESLIESLKDKMGFLTTDPYILSKITGREYLRLLCLARQVKVEDWDTKNIFDLPLDQYAESYSTGMQKKLAITAILLQKNEIFILDEPFNGVDIQSNILITEIIHHLKSLEKTIIISSHIFSTLSDTCDTIFHLSEGKIKQQYQKTDFHLLESEIKEVTIGDRIKRLALS
ncbi:MAG: ABC-2 type transport system ATP-binding protein [Saprospiraceae bacterium]|jgi:ABC-2 type transport system ATP-binding protein